MSDELLHEFLFDAREHLSTAGAQLLELEKQPASLAAVNALMGTLHTIKGNSGFLDLPNLYKLLHNAESLLQTVRERQTPCPQRMIDLLLQVLDTVEALLDRLESGGDDQVDWLAALTEALAEGEAGLEAAPPAPEPKKNRPAESPAAQAPAAQAPACPAVSVEEDLGGQIKVLALRNCQLAEEAESLTARVEAMFAAGLSGLTVDLRELSSLSARELKTLMAIGRRQPGRTAFLLTLPAQENLHRVFKVLRLDSFMHFFPECGPAAEFLKNGRPV